jgi:hypothetical protein
MTFDLPAQRRALLNNYDKQIKDQQKKRDALHPNFHVQNLLEKVRAEIDAIDRILAEVRPEMKRRLHQFWEVRRQCSLLFIDSAWKVSLFVPSCEKIRL